MEEIDPDIAAHVRERVYQSYRTLRLTMPNVPIEEWRLVYADIEALEARYQAELLQDRGKL